MAMEQPLVSCLMPTRNRPRFVSQSVEYFLRQDYPHRELVVVDDGEEQVRDLLPRDDRIRYVRLEHRHPLGTKRNIGCEAARGDLVAHWDDDDWQGPHRLSTQVAALQGDGAVDVCGTVELLHYAIREGRAYRYHPVPDDPPWLAGCSLVYRREAWSSTPFAAIDVGEDAVFVRTIARERGAGAVLAVPDGGWLVALLHAGNTGPKNLRDPRFSPVDMAEVTRLLRQDLPFYVSVRTGRWPDPTRPARHSAVTLVSDLLVHEGYGAMAEYLALGMEKAGADVRLSPMRLDRRGLTAQTLALLDRPVPDSDGPTLYSSWLRPEFDRLATRRRELVAATMWESSRLPRDWADRLNRAAAVVVPSRYVREVMLASGVLRPLFVVPEGVDPAVHHLLHRPERETTTTLVVAAGGRRKHLAEAVAGWLLAFAEDPCARLVIKTSPGTDVPFAGDPRVSVLTDSLTTRGLAALYRAADVLLALGSEGFGLPLVEGMATGLPVVALSSEGQADVCREAPDLVLTVPPRFFEEADDPGYGRCGVRGVPNPEDVAARLRWVADHPADARTLGREASKWALRHRNVWTRGPAVLEVLEQVCDPPRPLRRRTTVWAPSLGSTCGVGEYTGHLLGALPGSATGTSQAPDPRAVRLLHVQHEDGLYDESRLTSYAERLDGRLVVTEHSVNGRAHGWEHHAAALVSLTARGATVLAGRCPGSRVEHIPHGCSTWFPPRKRRRGRVVGTFGFLESYKGIDALVGLTRHIHDIEVVLYCHPKRAADEVAFAERISGRPVRWSPTFLPEREVAGRLAAECDVLAFWYDATPLVAASGAARVGLATGVPVLTSPTVWFEDLAGATYQPDDLADGVSRLLEDTTLRREVTAAAREYCEAHTWRRVAQRHAALWRSVEHQPAHA